VCVCIRTQECRAVAACCMAAAPVAPLSDLLFPPPVSHWAMVCMYTATSAPHQQQCLVYLYSIMRCMVHQGVSGVPRCLTPCIFDARVHACTRMHKSRSRSHTHRHAPVGSQSGACPAPVAMPRARRQTPRASARRGWPLRPAWPSAHLRPGSVNTHVHVGAA